ncbi:MAG: hypothetical protein ACP5NX_03540 [Candidatus Bilamarchaeaceae archaeon]
MQVKTEYIYAFLVFLMPFLALYAFSGEGIAENAYAQLVAHGVRAEPQTLLFAAASCIAFSALIIFLMLRDDPFKAFLVSSLFALSPVAILDSAIALSPFSCAGLLIMLAGLYLYKKPVVSPLISFLFFFGAAYIEPAFAFGSAALLVYEFSASWGFDLKKVRPVETLGFLLPLVFVALGFQKMTFQPDITLFMVCAFAFLPFALMSIRRETILPLITAMAVTLFFPFAGIPCLLLLASDMSIHAKFGTSLFAFGFLFMTAFAFYPALWVNAAVGAGAVAFIIYLVSYLHYADFSGSTHYLALLVIAASVMLSYIVLMGGDFPVVSDSMVRAFSHIKSAGIGGVAVFSDPSAYEYYVGAKPEMLGYEALLSKTAPNGKYILVSSEGIYRAFYGSPFVFKPATSGEYGGTYYVVGVNSAYSMQMPVASNMSASPSDDASLYLGSRFYNYIPFTRIKGLKADAPLLADGNLAFNLQSLDGTLLQRMLEEYRPAGDFGDVVMFQGG